MASNAGRLATITVMRCEQMRRGRLARYYTEIRFHGPTPLRGLHVLRIPPIQGFLGCRIGQGEPMFADSDEAARVHTERIPRTVPVSMPPTNSNLMAPRVVSSS